MAVSVTVSALTMAAEKYFVRKLKDEFCIWCPKCGHLWRIEIGEPCKHQLKDWRKAAKQIQ